VLGGATSKRVLRTEVKNGCRESDCKTFFEFGNLGFNILANRNWITSADIRPYISYTRL